MNKAVYLFIVFLIVSCSLESDSTQEESNDLKGQQAIETSPEYLDAGTGPRNYEYSEFKDFYRDFFISLMDDSEDRFNNFISPRYGLYIIDSKGAMPVITLISEISSFIRSDNRSIFSIDKQTIGYEMLEDELPKIDCDASHYYYDKTGCYTQSTNRLIDSEIWKHANLDEATQEKIVSLAETISKTVVNTANYVYYFSYVDGSWRLTFLDIRKPCEA